MGERNLAQHRSGWQWSASSHLGLEPYLCADRLGRPGTAASGTPAEWHRKRTATMFLMVGSKEGVGPPGVDHQDGG